MSTRTRAGTATIILVAVALLTVPFPALASHNSAGGYFHASQADEVDDAGNLQPDVPRSHPFSQVFHEEVSPPREQPEDQSGDRYTECNGPGDTSTYDPWSDASDCYIGFFDAQWEYLTYAGLLAFTPRNDADPLYSLNPSDGDAYCTGQDSPNRDDAVAGVDTPPVDGGGPIDQSIARTARSDDDQCSGDTHKWFSPSHLLIDQDLVEAAFQGDQNAPGATDVVDTPAASGTQTIPAMSRPYLFIFGQPHPNANPEADHLSEDGKRFTAGHGPFGANPAAGGNPLFDISNACDGRTQECKLLTPEDIMAYDRHKPSWVTTDQARVCGYAPQFSVLNPGSLTQEGCGPFGDTVGDFIGQTGYGGFGTGAADTWIGTQPGWTRDVNYVAGSQWQLFFDEERTPVPIERPCRSDMEHADMCGAYFADEPKMDPGTFVIYAVNPRVPSLDHDLWCLQPNILGPADGDEFYGYQADALEFDLYTHFLVGPARTALHATHPIVRNVTSPVEPLLDVNTPAELLRGGAEDAVKNALGPENEELYERADYTEDGQTATHNTPGNTQKDFTKTLGAEGEFACQPNGVIQKGATENLDGGLVIDVDVDTQQGGIAIAPLGIPLTSIPPQQIKDPTATEDDGTPAREDETNTGTWRPTLYSFNGRIAGVLDDNTNGAFDACKQFTLQAQPSRDACPWRALWDAYNPECTGTGSDDRECGAILEQRGYDVLGTDASEPSGVGLYWTLNVTGPLVLVDEDLNRAEETQNRTRVVGDTDPTATNCIVGVSKGFEEHLPSLFSGAETVQAAADQICAGVNGETHVIVDAFDDQGGAGGGFSSAVQFAKLAPTPTAVRDSTGGFGDSDEICIHGSWAVKDGLTGPTSDTEGDVGLTADLDPWRFTDCDSLASGTS